MVLTRFLSHLWSQIGPLFKALSALRGAKITHHGLKTGPFHLFVHPQIVQNFLCKNKLLIHFCLIFGRKTSAGGRHA